MKLKDLFEAPLADISYHNHRIDSGSFDEKDVKLIKKYIETNFYKERLKTFPFNLYAYVIDSDWLKSIGELFPEMEISKADLNRGYKKLDTNTSVEFHLDLKDAVFHKTIEQINQRLESDPSGVHFILGDNFSEVGQVSLTPWILVHRFVHAASKSELFDKHINQLIKQLTSHLYNTTEKMSPYISIYKLLTMKSAKSNNIQDDEHLTEMITQLLYTGKITINYDVLKSKLSKEKFDQFVEESEQMLAEIYKQVPIIVKKFKGKIFYI